MDVSIPMKLATKFAASTGIEFELLYQEALEAYWVATVHPTYDPRKSSLSTYATTSVYNRLLDVVASHKRHPVTEEIDEGLPSPEPGPEHVAFISELLRQLPDDAKVVVDLVFNVLDGIPPSRVKAMIRHMLRSYRWSHKRIDDAFDEVHLIVQEMDA